MANLNLSNQQAAVDAATPTFVQFRSQMDKRIAFWNKAPRKRKKLWITSGKDPVMTLAYDLWKYLDDNFFGEVRDDG